MENEIRKQVQIDAPVARVWRALTDYREFGAWFGVSLEEPFAVGSEARGRVTHPGYEHITWRANITVMQPESVFAFTWHPYGIDPDIDYSKERPTTVEFRLEASHGGTLLTLTESGFDEVPENRRGEAFRMNEQGWTQQMQNIAQHVGNQA